MQNLIKIYHLVQELFAISLSGSERPLQFMPIHPPSSQLKYLYSNKELLWLFVVVTSSRPGGIIVMWFYVVLVPN